MRSGVISQTLLSMSPTNRSPGKFLVHLLVCLVCLALILVCFRLHVNIYDTAKEQFTVPSSVISVPAAPEKSYQNASDLVFNYDPSPFAFWITRRSEPDAQPLFDTRIGSLPPTPIPPLNSSDGSTALDGFPLVFEDSYLQLTSALPLDANIYGLGEVVASSGIRRDVGGNGGLGTIQTMWNRDIQDPLDQNLCVNLSLRILFLF